MLPPLIYCSMAFFQAVIKGEKQLIPKASVLGIDIAKLPEFKISEALKHAASSEDVRRFIPDHWFKAKSRVCRWYIWNCINTVHPGWVSEITQHAYAQRFHLQVSGEADEELKVCS